MDLEPELKETPEYVLVKDGWQVDLEYLKSSLIHEQLYYTHNCKDGEKGAAVKMPPSYGEGRLECRRCHTPISDAARAVAHLYIVKHGQKKQTI